MLVQLSDDIQRDVETTIRSKVSQSLVLDVYATAEEIRRKHSDHEVGLEEIAATVARVAAQCGCAVEFGKSDAGAERPAV